MVEHRGAVELYTRLAGGNAGTGGSSIDNALGDTQDEDGGIIRSPALAGTAMASESPMPYAGGETRRDPSRLDAQGTGDEGRRGTTISSCPAAAGTAMTLEGPVPYAGSILDNPDIVWMDDLWTKDEEDEALRAVAGKGPHLSTFWRNKYEKEARKSWDLFYGRNAGNFFKDRHYLGKVFPELAEETDFGRDIDKGFGGGTGDEAGMAGLPGRRVTLLELGCGVGNAVFPLLEENRRLYVFAVDLSPKGIEVLKRHPMYSCGRCQASVLDATVDDLPPGLLEGGGVDLVLLQFSLSAVAPKDMVRVAKLAERALRPGGKLLFRDYGRHDEAQLRFAKGRQLGENLYVRQDGTTSYFFSLEDLRRLFCGGSSGEGDGGGREVEGKSGSQFGGGGGGGASLIEEELSFVRRQYANRGQGVARRRVWAHGKFRKPVPT